MYKINTCIIQNNIHIKNVCCKIVRWGEMIWRLLFMCACWHVLSLVVSSQSVLEDCSSCVNLTGQRRIREISENVWNEDENEYETSEKNDNSKLIAEELEEVKIDDSTDSSNPWYTNIPLLPVVFASSSTLPDGPCKKQAQRYLSHLKNGTLWATQMYDASTKYPDGLISGHTRHFGDFDGCYNLKVKLPDTFTRRYGSTSEEEEIIAGRYCLVDIRYEKRDLSPLKANERHDLEFDPNDSVWEAIREKGDFRRVKRYLLQMALCVPDVCNSSDIESALAGPLEKFGFENKLNLEVSVQPHFCQARKDAPVFSRAAKIYCVIVVALVTLMIASTCYDFTLKDYDEKVTSTMKDLTLCFSARRNFNALMETTSGDRGLETLHLMRFFFLVLTLIGHRTVEYYTGPVMNISYMEWLYTRKFFMLVVGGPLVVETFFGMGGLLITHGLLTELDAKKKINFFGPIIIRFLRLTPSYMLVVFFNALILPHLGSGPYWEWKVGLERDGCWNNWWTNLLYINNYVNPEMICMFQSWYLAVDYHLYILALMIVYIFWRMPRKTGYLFLCAIILGGCVVPFMCTYFYNVQPLYKGLLYMQDVRYDPYFTGHYVKTHERITSYFIGVLFGAMIYDRNRISWRLGKVSSNIFFILIVVSLSLGTEIVGHKYYDPNAKSTILEAALYASLHRGVFAIATCSVPLFITFGEGLDFHYKFLTPRWVQPLGRLTYGAYLVHTAYQLYDVGVTRSARSFGIHNMFWDFIPDVACAFATSLLLALIVEGPFRRIEKRFIMKRAKSDVAKNSMEETKKMN